MMLCHLACVLLGVIITVNCEKNGVSDQLGLNNTFFRYHIDPNVFEEFEPIDITMVEPLPNGWNYSTYGFSLGKSYEYNIISGGGSSIEMKDDYVYVGSSGGFFIHDVSEPSSQKLVGSYPDDPCEEMHINDTILFCIKSAFPATLKVFDISDPHSVYLLHLFEFDGIYYGRDVTVDGEYVFTTHDLDGLIILKYSISEGFSLIGSVSFSLETKKILVEGDYAYLPIDYNGLQIVDISNKSSPFPLGISLEIIESEMFTMEFYNDVLILANHYDGILFIDVSDKYSPLVISTYGDYTYPHDLSLEYNPLTEMYLLYVACSSEMCVLDVTSPDYPARAGQYSCINLANSDFYSVVPHIDTERRVVYFGGRSSWDTDCECWSMMRAVDVSDMQNPFLMGEYDDFGPTVAVVSGGERGKYIFQAVDSTLYIYEFESGQIVGFKDVILIINDVIVVGDYAYIGTSFGLDILNIADPSDIYWPGSTGGISPFYDIFIEGGYLYTACLTMGLRIIDVTNPMQPIEIGSWDLGGFVDARKVHVVDDIVYLADGSRGLDVIDVSNKENPVHLLNVGTSSPTSECLDVFHDKETNTTYVLDYNEGLMVFSSNFTLLEKITMLYPINLSVDRLHRKLYISQKYNYWEKYDIQLSNPSNPVLEYTGTEVATAMFVTGNRLSVLLGDSGFKIYKLAGDLELFGPVNFSSCGVIHSFQIDVVTIDTEYSSPFDLVGCSCFGELFTSPDACGLSGNCTGPDICVCSTPGYYQSEFGGVCNITTCYGIWNNQSESCGEHGVCDSLNHCVCDDGYYVDPYVCNMTQCFYIPQSFEDSCGSHGVCTSLDICTCDRGYYGFICEVTECYGIMSNETDVVCSGYGFCDTDTLSCVCFDNDIYFGTFCNVTTCYGVMSNDTFVCNGHGVCELDTQFCDCDDDYDGDECDEYTGDESDDDGDDDGDDDEDEDGDDDENDVDGDDDIIPDGGEKLFGSRNLFSFFVVIFLF